MPSTITLKRRINSIRSTRQITKAMELVSASKLRRAQAIAQRSREYQELAYELLQRLSVLPEAELHPMLVKKKINRRLYVMIGTNSGLAGAYSANISKELLNRLQRDRQENVASSVIAVGNKGAQFVRRLAGVKLAAVYQPFGDQPTAEQIRPLLNTAIKLFKDGEVEAIELIYTSFISTVNQKVTNMLLLPAAAPDKGESFSEVSTFEPDAETVIDQVITRLIEAQIWQAVLESLASEHAMRMMATKNATDNATELINDYTLALNTARQAAITQELAEITGGSEALNEIA
jgi:F-type H+-transporting ATPase subunit gamma